MLYTTITHNKVAEPSQAAIIKDKRIKLWKDVKPHVWEEFEYRIDKSHKKRFMNKECNVSLTVNFSSGKYTYYSYLTFLQRIRLKRMFGNHWTQQPEWQRTILGYFAGLLSGYLLWLITHK